MRSERRFVPMVAFVFLWIGLGCSSPPDLNAPASPPPVAPYAIHLELGARFQEAEGVLYALLVPNTMARTVPRTDEEVADQIACFHTIAAHFAEMPSYSVPFLHGLVAGTRAGESDPGLCALQLLYEIGTDEALRIIESAQGHPDEVVSRTAKNMSRDHQDLLWGFKSSTAYAVEPIPVSNETDHRAQIVINLPFERRLRESILPEDGGHQPWRGDPRMMASVELPQVVNSRPPMLGTIEEEAAYRVVEEGVDEDGRPTAVLERDIDGYVWYFPRARARLYMFKNSGDVWITRTIIIEDRSGE